MSLSRLDFVEQRLSYAFGVFIWLGICFLITLCCRVEIIKVLIMNSIPYDIDLRYELIKTEATKLRLSRKIKGGK